MNDADYAGRVSTEEPEIAERWPASRRLALGALVLTLIAGAALVFLPIGWQINRFIVWLFYFNKRVFGFSLFTLEGYEFALNILLFAVIVALAQAVWRSVPWLVWVVAAAIASGAVEAVQLTVLPRDASMRDWVANSIGGVIGAAAKAWPNRAKNARQEAERKVVETLADRGVRP